MFKNALVSVSNKEGLIDFLKPLVAQGMRVVSTGGTSKHLRDNGIKVVEVAEQTGFPEVMDGRVRTLHPSIHMALLARGTHPEDMELLKQNGLEPFDLVIVNLYPFEGALEKKLEGEELIEFIDIGGPSLLRGAAKTHHRLAVVCDPQDYSWISERAHQGQELSLEERRRLAAKVYTHTSRYDALIAATLDPDNMVGYVPSGRLQQELRYGENPQQKAFWFRQAGPVHGLHQAEILHGKALSFNNILDLEAACSTVREFHEPCAVGVKHNNPCGVGFGAHAHEAIHRSLTADPTSIFGGIVAVNRKIDLAGAEELAKLFLECVIAPDFAPDALARLQKKKDLRLLRWPQMMEARPGYDFRSISGGYLLQNTDHANDWSNDWQIVGEAPSAQLRADLVMAWKVCAHLKSNAIALAANGQTVGLGMGQVNRVDAVEQAIARMKKYHSGVSNVVLASDAFFPFADSVELAAAAGVRWVIQPGGSIRDEEVLQKARELRVNMVLTKTRHFRH